MPILQIRDENGKFIGIKAIKGNDGRSAYEQAKDGGYRGTEEEFIALLNGMINNFEGHVTDTTLHVSTNENGGVSIGGGKASVMGVAIGDGSTAIEGGAVGFDANTTSGGAVGSDAFSTSGGAVGLVAYTSGGGAVGEYSQSTSGGAVGQYAYAGAGFAGGKSARTTNENHDPIDAIQLGEGTNTEEKTLQVYSYQLMDANGHIPNDRFPAAEQLRADIDYIAVMTGVEL